MDSLAQLDPSLSPHLEGHVLVDRDDQERDSRCQQDEQVVPLLDKGVDPGGEGGELTQQRSYTNHSHPSAHAGVNRGLRTQPQPPARKKVLGALRPTTVSIQDARE